MRAVLLRELARQQANPQMFSGQSDLERRESKDALNHFRRTYLASCLIEDLDRKRFLDIQ